MRRNSIAVAIVGLTATLSAGGCAGRPVLENPVFIRGTPTPNVPCPNPIALGGGPSEYAAVFEAVLSSLDDYFEIAYANRYDGTIRTHPKIAPGLEQPWKPGSPDGAERMLATLQSIRYRADATICPGRDGGYVVHLIVYKELEDVPQPIRATAGAAAFRSDNTVDRQFEVVDPSVIDTNWIPKGREVTLEQEILKRIVRNAKRCLPNTGG